MTRLKFTIHPHLTVGCGVIIGILESLMAIGRRGGLVVERRTTDREVGGSILTRVALLHP